ncbi:MAG: HAMP domain-containing histidine kinase [Acidobacteriota bacterium]|nr:HAMP domain-containing histidine kinase [Acidobacteriota bacterium]
MSLRRRLVAGMLALLVAAVVVTDVVTLSSLRSYLFGRLDEQNDAAQAQEYSYVENAYARDAAAGDKAAAQPATWLTQLAEPTAPPADLASGSPTLASPVPLTTIPSVQAATAASPPARAGRLNAYVLATRVSPDVYFEVLRSDRQVILRRPSGSLAHEDPAPVLPRGFPVSRAPRRSRFGTGHGPYVPEQLSFTAGALHSHWGYYLGEAVTVPGGILVTLSASAPAEQTLSSVTSVEVAVSAGVALAMVVLALWTVRLGLRPLDEMTDTARAIAGGDMRRRVRRADEHSEVGRLGAALNGMLGRIEAALAERTRSESRLRRFVADASHELRTPLTSIRGYAELLRKGALDDDAGRRRAAERIEREAARMGVLVDDLLLLARLDQGRPLEQAAVDLSVVVGEAVDAARAASPAHRVVAELEPGVTVRGDAGRLRQVADNLLQNVAVHTPAGSTARVTVARADGVARLVVTDDGPGLSTDDTAHAFDRFYRGSGSRGRPGTGLGLSIVDALATAHGGWAEAGPGEGGGARFVVELPLDESRPPGAKDREVGSAARR